MTAEALLGQRDLGSQSATTGGAQGMRIPRCSRPRPRLRVRSYNLGGVTTAIYDTLCQYLSTQPDLDILFLQELHWGLGREESTWVIPGWLFVAAPDPASRYSGVGMVISTRIASPQSVTFCTWAAGRILQVRCQSERVTLDLFSVYQWVRRGSSDVEQSSRRSDFWHQLSRALGNVPRRNLLIVGGDMNSTVEPKPGLIGRGLLRDKGSSSDAEFLTVIEEHNLCLLNTWGSSRNTRCATFRNGNIASQLDFIAVRREAADRAARQACPVLHDLAPWRAGPRHLPVHACIPFVAGWTFARTQTNHLQYSRDALAHGLQHNTQTAVQFKQHVQHIVHEAVGCLDLDALNRSLLQACRQFFPATRNARFRPGAAPEVVASIRHMWQMHTAMRRRTRGTRMQQVFSGWVKFARFRRAAQAVHNTGRTARRRWLQERIALADQAANRHDLRTVFQIIQQIAPKKRKEGVRIRGDDGQLLDVHQQFHDLLQYFRTVFSRSQDFDFSSRFLDPGFSKDEVLVAIQQLRSRKAVPKHCPVAEVWQCCPDVFADYFLDAFQSSRTACQGLPHNMTDCKLSLLPKPGKPNRLPRDLRPLGLQCPSSKVLASLVRDRIWQQTQTWLRSKPQYAYIPQRSIDEAIGRVFAGCGAIRHLMKDGADSVHARRRGAGPQSCIGGALISLDLSRAFDCVPRQALVLSLQAASVSPDLIDLVIALHEGCNYTIEHGAHSGNFRLEQGVRQGCCLSPILFAIFTGWIYDLLVARTDEQWAKDFVTIFADDWLLQFLIRSTRDLAKLGPYVRAAFDVLSEVGMTVNPSKSKIVLRVIGSQAKAWLKQHVRRSDKGPVVSLGLPHKPLHLPRVTSITYLGVEASLTSFEMQTCRLRLKMCMAVKHRLVRLLHSSGLSLRHKVTLYRASIRSSMLYGLHAVGLTQPVLRRIDAADSRSLRALARSPSHITHESTAALRARLHINSPSQALQQLLVSRVKRSQDSSARVHFQIMLIQLQQQVQDASWAPLGMLRADDYTSSAVDVHCSECGQQFSRMRFLHQHHARKHPELALSVQPAASVSYASNTVDGMPTCRHCLRNFRRVEALKKHLKRSCPVLHGGRPSRCR